MEAETAVLVGGRPPCTVRLAALVEFGRAARNREVALLGRVSEMCLDENQCQDRSDKLCCWGHCTVYGPSLAWGCVLRKQKTLAALQE